MTPRFERLFAQARWAIDMDRATSKPPLVRAGHFLSRLAWPWMLRRGAAASARSLRSDGQTLGITR
jgi:hypothetical protein